MRRLMQGYLEKVIQTPMAQGRSNKLISMIKWTKLISMIEWIRTTRLSIDYSMFGRSTRGI